MKLLAINFIHTALSSLLRPNKLYREVYWGGDVEYKIFERPGRWLQDAALSKLVGDLRTVAHASQGTNIPNYGVLRGDRDDLENRIITIGYEKKTSKPVGFAAQIFLDVKTGKTTNQVLHLGLVYVSPEFRKKSIVCMLYFLPNFITLLKRAFRPIWISNVSQVPAVVGLVADYYQHVYPDPIHNNPQTAIHKAISEAIVKNHKSAFGTGNEATYDAERQIILNSYTGGSDNLKKSFELCSRHRHETVNSFCYTHLDYERGDDFIQIGKLTTKLIYKFLMRRIFGHEAQQWLYQMAKGLFIIFIPAPRYYKWKVIMHV